MNRSVINPFRQVSLIGLALLSCLRLSAQMGGGNLPQTRNGSGGIATLRVSPANYSGSCPVTLHFQGNVNYNEPGNGMNNTPGPIPGWQINFAFYRSDGQQSGVMMAPVNTPTPASYDWQITQSMQGWVYLQGVLEINGNSRHQQPFQSAKAAFSVNCLQRGGLPARQTVNVQHGVLCPNPRLLRVTPGSGHPGAFLRLLAETRLPAEIFFEYNFQDRAHQLQAAQYSIAQLINASRHWLGAIVPFLAAGNLTGNFYIQDACGSSNALPFQYQPLPAAASRGPYRPQTPGVPASNHAPGYQPLYHQVYHPYHPVRRLQPQLAPPLTPQQQSLRAQKLAELRQASIRMVAQVHARELAVQADWQRRQLARQSRLYQNLMAKVRMPALRETMQQHVNEYQQTILNISRARQPIQMPALKLNAGQMMYPVGEGGTGSGGGSGNTCPVPVITSLSAASGQPNDPLLITGSHFGASGSVNMIVPPNGQTVSGQVNQGSWTDGQIFTTIPQISGFANPYNGYIHVVNSCGQSSMVAFQFQPAIQITVLPVADTNAYCSSASLHGCVTGTSESQIGYPEGSVGDAFQAGMFTGFRTDDQFFINYQLRNGWVLDSVALVNYQTDSSNGCSSEGDQPGSSSPYVKVHCWVDAPFGTTGYALTIYIHGPVGVAYQ